MAANIPFSKPPLIPFFLVAGCYLLWNPFLVQADGFRNPFQSASAIGQGVAFIAQADDPSAIHYNPAGMTQLAGVQHAIGVSFVSPSTTFRNAAGSRVKYKVSGGAVGLPPPGSFFLTMNMGDYDLGWFRNLSIGLGAESLFGFSTNTPKDSPLSNVVTKAQLPLLDIKPTMAFKINEYLSLGLGADIFTFASFVGEGHAEQQSIALGNIPGTTAGETLELNGSGTTAGMNASLLLTPWHNAIGKPLVNFGFVWRSQAVLPLDGDLLANGRLVANASTTFKFPESYEWGLAAWPIRNREHEWKLEVDVHLVRWQTIRNFDVTLSNGVVISQPQRWKNAVTIGAGTEFNWLKVSNMPNWEFAARLGYIRSHSPIPDSNFNPSFPDSNNHTLSIGVGFSCAKQARFLGFIECGSPNTGFLVTKGLTIDLAFQTIIWEPRTVTDSPIPVVNGTYKTRTYAGAMTFQVNF